ncbi:transposase [Escherichia coli]|nr:transposase [Escherichia coli]AUL71403.1 transposase [Escherichia coli]OKT26018.1 transposase [Escherichia coli]OKT43384.1 transposase [Escherichia coli]OKT58220.1 transposase [Escherichia coli]
MPDHKMFWFWHTEFGHLSIGNMLTLEQHRCSNEKRKFQRRV